MTYQLISSQPVQAYLFSKSYTTNPDTFSGSASVYDVANEEKWGTGVEDYERKIKEHQSAATPYYRSSYKVNLPVLSGQSGFMSGGKWKTNTRTARQTFGLTATDIIPLGSHVDQARDIALASLKRKLAISQNEFQTLVPLGELRETRGLLSNLAGSTSLVLHSMLNLKSILHKRPQELYKRVSELWLNFSFGVKPLVSDINSGLLSINDYLKRQDKVRRFTGSNTVNWTSTNGGGSTNGPTGFPFKWKQVEHNHTYKATYTAGVKFDLVSANSYSVNEAFGLSFGDLIPAGWELIPYSWVVDYFTTAGAYLEDTFSSNGGDAFYVTLGELYTRTTSSMPGTDFGSSTTSTLLVPVPPTYASIKSVIYKRTVLPSLPHRAFRIKSVDEVTANAFNRVLNLASVLVAGPSFDYKRRR